MTEDDLGELLRERYDNALRNEATIEVILFGIDYAKEINCSLKILIEKAGIQKGYLSELNKGIQLSKYVKRK